MPFKNYSLRMIDQMIEAHDLAGPFLDAGCGRGDVALHLAQNHGWQGLAVDFSDAALGAARQALNGYPVEVRAADLLALEGHFRTIVMCTVIEHIKDDRAVLRHLRGCIGGDANDRDGCLIISMPSNPTTEWRWDDDFYGHYRRYTRDDVDRLLRDTGFEMIEFWDYTYPVFWAMRRVYTALFPAREPMAEVPEVNSASSAMQNAWEMGLATRMITALPIWPLVFRWQERYKLGPAGFEAIALARAV
ncbi:MAG: class I SAM-dependent methyltransferase [Propionivibrio sp.]|nr:class I SAM-dependent methyltransferase [Propionivibrio sp.]